MAAAVLAAGISAKAQNTTDAQKAAEEAARALAVAPTVEEPVKKPQYWTNSLLTKADFLQTNLTNWAAGGYNTFSASVFLDGNANYKKDKTSWDNRLQIDYGFLYSSDKPVIQKNVDRFYLESKWGLVAAKTLKYTAQFNFKSQFSNGYKYPVPNMPEGVEPTKKDWKNARVLQSGLFSPAYTNIALGIDWVPAKWLTVNVAPLTGGFVITSDNTLRKSYGMERKGKYKDETAFPYTETNADGNSITHGEYYKAARFEFGAQVKIDAKLKINDNFSYTSQIVLFSDYLEKPQNVRVNWDNRFDWKLAKYFSLTLTTNLIYDDKVLVKTDDHPDGKKAIQFKETFAFGFSYTITNKRK